MNFQTENILGYQVSYEPINDIVRHLTGLLLAQNRSCCYFACLNPHSVEIAARDPGFKDAMLGADFLTADGIGVVLASRLGGGNVKERTTGTDVFEGLTGAMNAAGGLSCFFLGSTEETLRKVRERMDIDYPKVRVAGTYSPPFKTDFDDEDSDAMIRSVNESGADVLWVGMTAPKQEKWIYQNRDRLKVSFAGPIGAVFDFYAGNIKRAGPAWQGLGLEWLPRLLQEPRRLWRRNLVSSPAFLVRFFKYRFSQSWSKR